MVVFSQYVTPMDREYGKSTLTDTGTNDVGIGIQDIGWGLPMGIGAQNIQGIAAKIREGAGTIEIQWPGAVRGARQAQVPGMYGAEQRQALRELAQVTEVKFTTHASFGIAGLAGMDQHGNFSKEQQKMAIDEIKQAIEWAADVAKGGPVVVHTGEFPRPISEEDWARKPDGTYQFMHHGEEAERAIFRVIDETTGQVMAQVRKNQTVVRPVWLTNEKGQYIDYEGNVVDRLHRVPKYDPKTGRFEVRVQKWDDLVKEAEELNREKEKELGRALLPHEKLLPEEAFLKATLEINAATAKGWALYYGRDFEETLKDLKKLREARVFYEKLEAATPEEERWKLTKSVGGHLSALGLVPQEFKLPTQIIDEQIKTFERRIEEMRQASSSQEQMARESEEKIEHVKSVRKYALEEAYKAYADAGIYAYDITKQRKTEKPVMITMENIYPESYGAHPQELKNLIIGARKEMAERLQRERHLSAEEAKKAAETHIKATIDVGHLNMWRKYWVDDPKKSLKENDDAFKKWLLEQTEDLAKNKIIGHVHLSDNYGYGDEHLIPGEGTTPIVDMIKILKKYGYEGTLTTEAGAAATTDVTDFHGLMKTWRLFGSPVYGAHVGAPFVPKATWTDIQYSYFGQTRAPYYIFGPYAPSQDWTLWSQVPFE